MKAGRELDILVANKVFGWEYDEFLEMFYTKHELGPVPRHSNFKPSTNITDAWQVLEKMQDRYQLGLMPTSFGKWVCRGYLPETAKIQVQAEAPLAICLAALEAVGWEGGEK
ncbi:BC1872 family protein [Aneurinibacillus aneurinilyticus]|uniref:Phage ABA sandwich domain-containing protein n=1 Tax=Aneurinibacillus aneurinilyticus ATCC 12856 TaxID=649747 RepID=U1Y9W8_ANEAE|nr:hypothetical protein [Aneurinibacillus aneurinilyticus]ERI08942.1 hypothetical protein HMPREF0083_02979 [Aneurinibacillus aneurinilyticus ATCC 12856]MED0705884.1 hypothetical protein [Aneurinibacillus aneurinilyticus]MED0722727.1 hypothetical protein [Aneurinibacillus aneurinilyticus]MED0731439.1 hypothetical protein [Aneurinibacillus aneurinilyticus]MED0740195.1 hypothetical protein [Aneurinibacillus aneurinilyticus]